MQRPAGIVTNNQGITDDIRRIEKVDVEQLSQLWKVYTTNKDVLRTGRRLENLFWRIWGSSRIHKNISGSTVASIFMMISEGEKPFEHSTNRIPPPPSERQASITINEPKEYLEEVECPPTPPPTPENRDGTLLTPTKYSKIPSSGVITAQLRQALLPTSPPGPPNPPPPSPSTPMLTANIQEGSITPRRPLQRAAATRHLVPRPPTPPIPKSAKSDPTSSKIKLPAEQDSSDQSQSSGRNGLSLAKGGRTDSGGRRKKTTYVASTAANSSARRPKPPKRGSSSSTNSSNALVSPREPPPPSNGISQKVIKSSTATSNLTALGSEKSMGISGSRSNSKSQQAPTTANVAIPRSAPNDDRSSGSQHHSHPNRSQNRRNVNASPTKHAHSDADRKTRGNWIVEADFRRKFDDRRRTERLVALTAMATQAVTNNTDDPSTINVPLVKTSATTATVTVTSGDATATATLSTTGKGKNVLVLDEVVPLKSAPGDDEEADIQRAVLPSHHYHPQTVSGTPLPMMRSTSTGGIMRKLSPTDQEQQLSSSIGVPTFVRRKSELSLMIERQRHDDAEAASRAASANASPGQSSTEDDGEDQDDGLVMQRSGGTIDKGKGKAAP